MKLNNKGWIHHVVLTSMVSAGGGTTAAGIIMGSLLTAASILPAAWHVPAWTKAKSNHTEAIQQTKQMWPQRFFGTKNATPKTGGNGGNFSQGNSGPIAE